MRGHFNGMVAVAERLLARGEQVGWACMGLSDPTPAIAAVESIGAFPLRLPWPFPRLLDGQAEEGRSVELRTRRFRRVTVENEVVEPCLEIIRRFEADVVALDPAFYSAIIAAELAGVPYFCVHTNLGIAAPPDIACERIEVDRGLAEARSALFARFGVEPPEFRRCESISRHANSLWTTESFLLGAPPPPRTRCVGSSIPLGRRPDHVGFDWTRLDDRPLIYASPGTVYPPPPAFFPVLARVCDRLELQLVIVSEALPAGADMARPPIVVSYAPQLEMLERAAVFVTHGGGNSIMEAIHFGCPMLVAPLASDQPVQAHLVEANGVGLAVDPYSVGPDPVGEARIEAALRQLVDPSGRLAGRLAALQADYRRHDGADAVAAAIAELA
ncbi:MAG TPA: glycosyltransferase [Kofleriaceae bacterium]|nr:glycosyltransferase [Kofleriaceae bacterium]